MPSPTVVNPNLLTEPGWLYRAPLGSTLPANMVAGSIFTDAWPAAWIWQGLTDTGSDWHMNLTVSPIDSAELTDHIAYRTTGRESSMTTQLQSFTATNLANALNGATVITTGTGATTMTQVDPPNPGTEVRCMIGFESVDLTVRAFGFQCINSGDISLVLAKAPAHTPIPFSFMFEKPATTQPFRYAFAGAARV